MKTAKEGMPQLISCVVVNAVRHVGGQVDRTADCCSVKRLLQMIYAVQSYCAISAALN